ncbi:MAG: prepilin-type N-terminal cleavage/methylation domain-containing protein [Candidatus Gastranaerophilales bacterium]|nr:prepilin-type N-terminal cleavage/methylation domain-containing protein [Candidatus Gastranaerophilales bacterium]
MKQKFAFTLAELMIVLSVIGVLTAILLPAVRNAMPDNDVMKFKKGHKTFSETVRELINSEKYYFNGDFGFRADKTIIDGNHSGDNTFFCETFADIVNVKEKNCQSETVSGLQPYLYLWRPEDNFLYYQNAMDLMCQEYEKRNLPYEIKTSDNIIYYQTAPDTPFGINYHDYNMNYNGNIDVCTSDGNCHKRLFDGYSKTEIGTNTVYKVFCMDIDGMNEGEKPFAYGVRMDGRIFQGKRAGEWVKKSVQGND